MRGIIVRKKYTVSSKCESRLCVDDNCEILLFLRGDILVHVNGRSYVPEPGDILLFGGGEIHSLTVNPGQPFERVYIYFDKQIFRQLSDKDYDLLASFNMEEGSSGTNLIRTRFARKYSLGEKLASMYELYQMDAPDTAVRMLSLMLDILVNVNLAHKEQQSSEGEDAEEINGGEKIHEILRYIVSNLNEKFTLDSISARFYISKYYLCHEFKRVVGMSCLEYIRQKRIDKARERLLGGWPVNDVWLDLGFNDYVSFYRSFKKVTGVSPNEYVGTEKAHSIDTDGGEPIHNEGS